VGENLAAEVVDDCLAEFQRESLAEVKDDLRRAGQDEQTEGGPQEVGKRCVVGDRTVDNGPMVQAIAGN